MASDKGLKIINQLLAEANIKASHKAKKLSKKSVLPTAPQDPATLRYIRTPEYDCRFEHGETYRDTQTGRIHWVSAGVDPNL